MRTIAGAIPLKTAMPPIGVDPDLFSIAGIALKAIPRSVANLAPLFERTYKFEDCNHITDPKALSTLAKRLSEYLTLNTYEIEDGVRIKVGTERIPKHFVMGVDTETTGIRIGVSKETFIKYFPDKEIVEFAKLLSDEEFADLSKHLRIIQLSIIDPKIIEEEYTEKCKKYVRQRVSVSENSDGESFLIYFTALENKLAQNPSLGWKSPIEPLKDVLENPEVILFIMNALFEDKQFKRLGIEITSVIDNMRQGQELRSDKITEAPAIEDIDSRSWPLLQDPGSFSMAAISMTNFGIRVSKDEQTSAWDEKLSKEQIDYAASDSEISLKYGLIMEGILSRQSEEIADYLQKFDFHRTSPESPKFSYMLTELIADIGRLYKSREEILRDSGCFNSCMELSAIETILHQQQTEQILPELYHRACLEFGNVHSAPEGFGIEIESKYGNSMFKPRANRGINFSALHSLGSYVVDRLELSLRAEDLNQISETSLRRLIRTRCLVDKSNNFSLMLAYTSDQVPYFTNPYIPKVKSELHLENSEISPEIVASHHKMAVEARAQRMQILFKHGQVGNELGLVNRKIKILREHLTTQLSRLARQSGYVASSSSLNMPFTTAVGRATLNTGRMVRMDPAEFVKLVASQQIPEAVIGLLQPKFSASKLSRVLEDLDYEKKDRDATIASALPVLSYSTRRIAYVSSAFGRVYK